MANRSGGSGADDSNRGSTNDAGETSPMMMSSSGIVADADNALLGELLDATEPVVRKNDNNKNNKNNNDNSALAAVTLEEALVESSSSLSMDDNEEEEGEEEKEEEMEGATSQDDDDDDFYINLDPMEHLSSSINEITRIQKANDQLRLENERILTRAKIAEQRRGEERLESSEHREELKRQVEMLTEDLRREKEIREEELFKLEQEKKEMSELLQREKSTFEERDETRRSEIESLKKHEEEMTTKLKNALKQAGDVAEKRGLAVSESEEIALKTKDLLETEEKKSKDLQNALNALKVETQELKEETIKDEQLLNEKIEEHMKDVENIKWEMDTKISALEVDKEELVKTHASDVTKWKRELEERESAILKLTLERDEVAESLRKEKGVLENDLKDANDAIAALTERINSEDSAIVLLEQATIRAETLEQAMEYLEEALQDDLIESEMQTIRAKQMLALAEEKSDSLEKRVQMLLDELNENEAVAKMNDASLPSAAALSRIQELEEELEEAGDMAEIRNAIMEECSLMREEVEIMEGRLEKMRIERDTAILKLSKYEKSDEDEDEDDAKDYH